MRNSWMWKQRSYREQFEGADSSGGAGGTAGAAEQGNEQANTEQSNDGETPPDEQQSNDGAGGQEADDELVITIGDQASPEADDNQPAPQWVKDLRKADREKAKRIRELEQQVADKAKPTAPALGAKPTLEGCEYDADRFEQELTGWHERKRAADAQTAAAQQEQEAAQKAWTERLTGYNTAKTALKVPDFEEAEAVVLGTLSQTQQGIIVNGADNPAHVVYALGKNPAKAKELASIKDPVKYAFAVAKLETQLKVTPRKAPPPAEKPVRGSAPATGMDSTLARLEAEADKTGDRSKVIAYRRDQRRSAA